jgi:hypothetical protein
VRLRNVSGYPLQIPALSCDVAPGEVIDTGDLGYDLDRDGPITGLEAVEDTPASRPTKATSKPDSKAPEKAAGDSDKETK